MIEPHTEQSGQAAFRHIVIVGLGRVGASFAAAVRAAQPDIRLSGVDVDGRTRAVALERGWADAAWAPDDPAFERKLALRCAAIVERMAAGLA